MRPFKRGTAQSFISKGIRIITSQSQKFIESALLLSKFKSVKVWPLVSQVHNDEKFYAVPHLKALINGIDTSSEQKDGSLNIKTMGLGKTWF